MERKREREEERKNLRSQYIKILSRQNRKLFPLNLSNIIYKFLPFQKICITLSLNRKMNLFSLYSIFYFSGKFSAYRQSISSTLLLSWKLYFLHSSFERNEKGQDTRWEINLGERRVNRLNGTSAAITLRESA